MSTEVVLAIEDLVVSYGGEKTALNKVNLQVRQGEIVGLLGPNGAGKTTLIKSIIGLIAIQSGTISLFGRPSSYALAKAQIGYMPEVANYQWFLTPKEILEMFGRISGIGKGLLPRRIDETLGTVELLSHKNQLVKTFSKGMQERLSIAQALLHDPQLLILDEPFSGLDPFGRIHIRNILKGLRQRNKTILLSSHELSEAELICDHVCIMKDGAVVQCGLLGQLLKEKKEDSLENYFLGMIGKTHE